MIAGNHDLTFEPETYAETAAAHNERLCAGDVEEVSQAARSALRSATYLEDSGVDIQGVRVYGSPWQPEFFDWAFNLPRGPALAEKWSRIPAGVDVLPSPATHAILMQLQAGEFVCRHYVGCVRHF